MVGGLEYKRKEDERREEETDDNDCQIKLIIGVVLVNCGAVPHNLRGRP